MIIGLCFRIPPVVRRVIEISVPSSFPQRFTHHYYTCPKNIVGNYCGEAMFIVPEDSQVVQPQHMFPFGNK
jgi:hypothetical protein